MICSGGPLGCRIRGHIEMNDPPATVKKDDEAVQNAEIDRRDCEKIYGRNLIRMIGKECLPGLRVRLGVFHSIFRHGLFRDIEPEEAQFRLDSGRTPKRVLARDAADQLPNLFVDRRTADRRFRLPAPIETEAFSMPFDDRIGFNNDQRFPPIFPESREEDPKEAIPATKLRPLDRAIEDEKLLPEDKDLRGER